MGPIVAWIEQRISSAETKTLPSVISLAITIALSGQAPFGNRLALAAHAMLTKLSCALDDEDTASALIEVLSELAFRFGPDAGTEGIVGAANEGPKALFLQGLGLWFRSVAGSDAPDVRQAIGYTIREWQRSATMPEELESVLNALRGDRRMRVRRAASMT